MTSIQRLAILDCDGGSDDAWALLLLLHAEQQQRVKLLAVTTIGCGNTSLEHAARNVRRILRATGREDIPIYSGAVDSLISCNEETKKYFHGRDGFGDCVTDDLCEESMTNLVQPQHAVTAIYELGCAHPQQITLFAVGPLTNLALGLAMYGEQFGQHLREIYLMGGNYQGVGNASRAAEFNFLSDPEAAHAVLLKAKCPITILPWEVCTEERFDLPISWRLEDFGPRAEALQHSAISLLNRVEAAQWLPMAEKYGIRTWNPCDALIVAAWLFEERFVIKHSSWHASVDLRGSHTRGQVVLDHLREREKYPDNVRIIELVDVEFFKRILEWAAGLSQEQLQ